MKIPKKKTGHFILSAQTKRENAMDNHISSRALLHRRDVIKNNPRFGEAITEHYRINDAIYKKQPLFYKTMLQESRFNIILSMCCFVLAIRLSQFQRLRRYAPVIISPALTVLSRSLPYLRPPGELRPGAVPKIAEKQKSHQRKKDWMS